LRFYNGFRETEQSQLPSGIAPGLASNSRRSPSDFPLAAANSPFSRQHAKPSEAQKTKKNRKKTRFEALRFGPNVRQNRTAYFASSRFLQQKQMPEPGAGFIRTNNARRALIF
jgi:hypothetical protein